MANLRTEKSVQNASHVVKYATENRLSLSESSRRYGFGRNYVSDVKARLEDNLSTKNVSRKLYNEFRKVVKAYDKASKSWAKERA